MLTIIAVLLAFCAWGKGNAPDPDPAIGEAALMSARTGKRYLTWMRDRAETTDAWAAEDRHRAQTVFQPLQDQFIETAKRWDSPAAQRTAAREAVADVSQQAALAQQQSDRAAAAMGVDPNSRRFAAGKRGATIDLALAKVGGANTARQRVRQQGLELQGQAINLGSGLAVNPLSSFTAGTSAISQGAQGAMQGYGQQGQLLNQQYQNQLQAWQTGQSSGDALFGAAGGLAGIMFAPQLMAAGAAISDEDAKENKRKVRSGGFLEALDGMRVEKWRYKPDAGDGGAADHVGTYAQDFQKATGHGDGKTIPIVDAIGLAHGAIKDLSAEVKALKRKVRSKGLAA